MKNVLLLPLELGPLLNVIILLFIAQLISSFSISFSNICEKISRSKTEEEEEFCFCLVQEFTFKELSISIVSPYEKSTKIDDQATKENATINFDVNFI